LEGKLIFDEHEIYLTRNATIMHKNEAVEYFAIVLGGKLLIKQGDKVIGHLGPGDVLGYMSYMEFPG